MPDSSVCSSVIRVKMKIPDMLAPICEHIMLINDFTHHEASYMFCWSGLPTFDSCIWAPHITIDINIIDLIWIAQKSNTLRSIGSLIKSIRENISDLAFQGYPFWGARLWIHWAPKPPIIHWPPKPRRITPPQKRKN